MPLCQKVRHGTLIPAFVGSNPAVAVGTCADPNKKNKIGFTVAHMYCVFNLAHVPKT